MNKGESRTIKASPNLLIMMLPLRGTCEPRPKYGRLPRRAGGPKNYQLPRRPGTRTPRRKIKQAIAFRVQPERGRWPGQLEIRRGGQARGHGDYY